MADKKRPNRIGFKSSGTTGLDRSVGYIFEDFLDELRFPNCCNVYKEMSYNDSIIASIIYLCEMRMREATWTTVPAGTSTEDKKAADFLKECMHDMQHSWDDFIAEALSQLVYGFSLHEIVYKIRGGEDTANPKYHSKYDDYKVGWRKLATRAQNTIVEWEFNDEGDVLGAWQQAPPTWERTYLPMNKLLHFKILSHKNNPEGKSPLRGAYVAWYRKKHLETIEAIGAERNLAGLPVLTSPEDFDIWDETDEDMVAQKNAALSLLENIRVDAQMGALIPGGWKLELMSASGSGTGVDIDRVVQRYNYNMAQVLLADIVLLGQQSGSYALAESKDDMLCSSLQAILGGCCDTINTKAVPALFKANGWRPKNGYPEVAVSNVKQTTVKEVALLLRTANLDVNHDIEFHNFIRTTCGMNPLDSKDFKKIYENRADATHNVGHMGMNGEVKPAASKPNDDDSVANALEGDTHSMGGGEQ